LENLQQILSLKVYTGTFTRDHLMNEVIPGTFFYKKIRHFQRPSEEEKILVAALCTTSYYQVSLGPYYKLGNPGTIL
jgi:hypothetical protein